MRAVAKGFVLTLSAAAQEEDLFFTETERRSGAVTEFKTSLDLKRTVVIDRNLVGHGIPLQVVWSKCNDWNRVFNPRQLWKTKTPAEAGVFLSE
jgi:hypothetical protein